MNHEVNHVLKQAHTAGQLIEMLEDADPDARVFFVCSYGDYHNTQQALPASEVLEHESDVLHESAYSQSGIAYTDPDADPEPDEDEDEDENETIPIVIIR